MVSPQMVLAIVIFSKGSGDRILWELFWVHVRTWLRLVQPEDRLSILKVFFWYLSGLLADFLQFSHPAQGLSWMRIPLGEYLDSWSLLRTRETGAWDVLGCSPVTRLTFRTTHNDTVVLKDSGQLNVGLQASRLSDTQSQSQPWIGLAPFLRFFQTRRWPCDLLQSLFSLFMGSMWDCLGFLTIFFSWLMWVVSSVCVATTKHSRLSNFIKTKIDFPWVWELEAQDQGASRMGIYWGLLSARWNLEYSIIWKEQTLWL